MVNEGKDGLQKLDYAIYKAEQEGVRLLITFTNNWEAFGGMNQYVKWAKLAGENVTGHDDFYTNETIKGWYKDFMKMCIPESNIKMTRPSSPGNWQTNHVVNRMPDVKIML